MEKGYKRLTPEQPVGLRHAGYVISVQRVIKVNQNLESIFHSFRASLMQITLFIEWLNEGIFEIYFVLTL